MQVSEEWLAGFWDGEGCFQIGKQIKNGKEYKHASILLSQSGEDGKELLLEIQKQYGGNFYQHLKIGQHKATKNAYKLYWNKEEGKQLIRRIKDKLLLKKNQAEELLLYLERNDNAAK